ncbi:hypothetical protein DE146DRAFT_750998 [Phaeosphaeria sp. MPI-PUGE-AT-0046c]|nr:hypothetical protein DE146DRAFT_750998 [Phaeosphaeria sp. MPI-PUGE-AT-0046c]
MRVLSLAVGTLGLASFTIGGVVYSKATPSFPFAHPIGTSLPRWYRSETSPIPSRSLHSALVFKRDEPSPTVTSFTPSCSPGYFYGPTSAYSFGSCDIHGHNCIPVSTWPTSACIQTMCGSNAIPFVPVVTRTSCTEIATKPKEPVTTSCSEVVTSGSIDCRRTSQDWGGTRSPRWVADFAARTTQDLGGRSQRAVARFAEPTAQASPTITSFTHCPSGYKEISSTAYDMSCTSWWSGGFEGTRSCTILSSWPTPACSQTVCPSDMAPRPPSYPTSSCTYSDIDFQTIPSCSTWTTTWPDGISSKCTKTPGSHTGLRSWRHVAQFATKSTQDLGGRSQRVVARFAEPTITARPTADEANEADTPFPACSFDLDKGRYICPKISPKTLPICSFDLDKGKYVCPMPAGAGVPTTLKTVKN